MSTQNVQLKAFQPFQQPCLIGPLYAFCSLFIYRIHRQLSAMNCPNWRRFMCFCLLLLLLSFPQNNDIIDQLKRGKVARSIKRISKIRAFTQSTNAGSDSISRVESSRASIFHQKDFQENAKMHMPSCVDVIERQMDGWMWVES